MFSLARSRSGRTMLADSTNRPRRKFIAVLLAALLTAEVAAASAGAQTTPDPVEGGEVVREVVAEYQDEAVDYSRDFGVSEVEALRRLEASDQLYEVIALVRELEKERLAGWGLDHETDRFGAWILLTGKQEPSAAARALEKTFPAFRIELGAEYTREELLAAMQDSTRFEALPLEVLSSRTEESLDMRLNQIVIGFDRNQLMKVEGSFSNIGAVGEELNRAYRSERSRRSGLPVFRVEFSSGSQPATFFEGGQQLDITNDRICTTGFGVQRNGTKGFLTAGHCRVKGNETLEFHWDTRTHDTTGSYNATVSVMRNTVWSEDGDAMWYSIASPSLVSDDFYVALNQKKDVKKTAQRLNMMGRYVCSFGISSGRSCGTVTSIDHDPGHDNCQYWWNDCDDIWVKVEESNGSSIETCGGDSGGPVFVGRTAYGIISTSQNVDCNGSPSYFSFFPIDEAERILDVTTLK